MFFLFITIVLANRANAQQLQLHYDVRHSLNPGRYSKNYPTLYFEYFKQPDSGRAFVKPGSFLLKLQADMLGKNGNMGKYYMQVSQEVRFWKPKIYINLQYSGGLGITEPRQYSYYINNTFCIGLSYPFKLGNAFLSSVLNYRYTPYIKPSKDFLYTLYFYRGFLNYRAELAGSLSGWTENKNHGDDATAGLQGKRFSVFAKPQFWYRLSGGLYAGSKLNIYYHVNTPDNVVEAYPTIAMKIKL
ncbi:hypothetical protein BC343_03035 [Mucilaginibacter pedocola]|uniref:DUF5020 domain-containing protein n=1 Tax=Mucilaginibacter pedocola TaxID=1792845 RepID=A0A1S9PM76_9SPHI|nr:hypothetical protein BC343_03035 [Mucilaginibacter pedocola]